MGKLDQIYTTVPVWMQNILVTTYGIYWHWLRFSGSYQTHLQGYKHREMFSKLEWQQYQKQLIEDLMRV